MKALLLAAAALPLAFAQQPNLTNVEIHAQPVQGNVYMLIGAGANITVQVGHDGVLIVDTEYAPLAYKILAAIKKISDRPLRFDLNEFAAAGSAARLVGTFDQPEGLLTAAVRRQPFAVILLDEVEKAHPEVFDLFLQVFDAGRLTDGQGHTVDAQHAIWIMTSNVGTDKLGKSMPSGFIPPTR